MVSTFRHQSLLLRSKTAVAADAQFLDLLNSNQSRKNQMCKMLLRRRSDGVMKSPKEGIQTIPMTLADGSRVYVRCRNNDDDKNINSKDKTTNNTNNTSKSCSLGVSMKELLRRVNAMNRNNVAIRRRIQVEENNSSSSSSNTVRGMVDNGDLWVDKHAPVSFPHLLSDERTNREVLRALRAWDPYVFGRQQPSRPTSHVLYQQRMATTTATI